MYGPGFRAVNDNISRGILQIFFRLRQASDHKKQQARGLLQRIKHMVSGGCRRGTDYFRLWRYSTSAGRS